jgi:hypothetical protein
MQRKDLEISSETAKQLEESIRQYESRLPDWYIPEYNKMTHEINQRSTVRLEQLKAIVADLEQELAERTASGEDI